MQASTLRRGGALVVLSAFLFTMPTLAGEANPPERGGFTLLLTMGPGWQANEFIDESAVGLSGLNLGIGGFVSPDVAVMFRVSGTNVQFKDFTPFGNEFAFDLDVIAGVAGVSVQYWVSDFVNIEGGVGSGVARFDPGDDEPGLGLIFGAGFSFFHRGRHSLQAGIEYAPVFIDEGNVHSIGVTFGWQLL